MRKGILFLWLLLVVYMGHAQQAAEVTMGSLLRDMTDPATVARFPSPAYTLQQTSSYDRRSVSPDQPGWFANADYNQFIREEKKGDHTEYVMMDAEGPGAIVRFWLTTVVKQGTMRLYFDNADTAAIIVPGFDLMRAGLGLGPGLLNPHSSYEVEGKGGNTLYLPLPYQKHCKVTWEFADTATMKTAHYYQINYRTYPAGTRVETFRRDLQGVYRGDIDRTEQLLWHPDAGPGQGVSVMQLVGAGKTLELRLPPGANAVRELVTSMHAVGDSGQAEIWRSVIVKITFDGVPTVFCPIGDFAGSGEGGQKISSWYRQLTDDGVMTSRWVMPYQKQAIVSFINTSSFAVNIKASARVSPFRWDKRSMYFHATFKYEQNVKDAKWDYDLHRVAKKDTAAPIDWNFVTIRGGGVYMGNTFAVDNHMDAWYGEGDAKAYVDGESFPSEFGTGLEDYYNTSWAPVVLYQTPFANAPRADHPSSAGKNTFTRTRILDAIPFTKAFSFDMEMLSWKGGFIDAGATTYWYGLPPL